ncbi:hypothetical protein HaLaN_19460, partial [Haematococcus lacustris]
MPHTINSAYDLAFELEVLRELLSSRQRRFSHYSELDAVQATEAWQKERLIGTTTPALLTLECLQEVRNDFVKEVLKGSEDQPDFSNLVAAFMIMAVGAAYVACAGWPAGSMSSEEKYITYTRQATCGQACRHDGDAQCSPEPRGHGPCFLSFLPVPQHHVARQGVGPCLQGMLLPTVVGHKAEGRQEQRMPSLQPGAPFSVFRICCPGQSRNNRAPSLHESPGKLKKRKSTAKQKKGQAKKSKASRSPRVKQRQARRDGWKAQRRQVRVRPRLVSYPQSS